MSSNVDFSVVPAGVEGVDPNHLARNRNIRIVDSEAGLITGCRSKLAIVGYATSSRDEAPFDDPEYDCAGINQIYRFLPREDVHFDIHVNWNEDNVEGTDHEGWLKKCGIPVVMSTPDWSIPTAVRYPIDACMQLGADYFTSTVAFMIAWSIHQGYKEVALYGIDLVVGIEYQEQRQCAEFWLGVAHGRGMTVRLPKQCALLKHQWRYGYQKEPEWLPVRLTDYEGRIKSLTGERDKLLAKLHALDGALHEVTKRSQWTDDPGKREDWLLQQRNESMAQLATIDGALQETCHWKDLAVLRHRGADIRLRI